MFYSTGLWKSFDEPKTFDKHWTLSLAYLILIIIVLTFVNTILDSQQLLAIVIKICCRIYIHFQDECQYKIRAQAFHGCNLQMLLKS
jgi:hypothetical protein